MKKAILFALIVSLLPVSAIAKKTKYITSNHRFNYVKLVELKPREADARAMTQPMELDEGQMRAILESIKLSRRHVLSKEVDSQDAFNESSINFLAPALVKAFREATSSDEVVFSFLMKEPFFILRNDRLNLGTAWIRENEMHIKFSKLYAKVTGDTDARGHEAKAIANSRGLGIDLELQPGQTMDVTDPEELVVDLGHNFSTDVAAAEAAKAAEPQKEKKSKKGKKEVAKAEEPAQAATEAEQASADKSVDVQQRLERLEQLKKDKLITNKEYKEKKKEILKDL